MANKERLQKVLDHLRNLDPKKFNYNKWVSDINGCNYSTLGAINRLDKNECGTTGCVAGWTCAIFKDQIDFFAYDTICDKAQKLLELSFSQVRFLFYAESYYEGNTQVFPDWEYRREYEHGADLDDVPIQEAIDRLEFAIQNF